ncbi:hypothetical protein F0562_005702 [Nyssa sinensis]|uniref:Uncharacterized protein n=1 Tax=Nyssa sinensis TaxID=561372 RepID=A0A5J5AL93_9ASTE|nr:hypothetical protein F0562_005702 [Nyssa sinensis]
MTWFGNIKLLPFSMAIISSAMWMDQIFLSTLIATLSESILSQILGYSTSRSIWVALESMLTTQSCAHVMQLNYQLAISKTIMPTVIDYFQKMRNHGETSAVVSQPLDDSEMVSYILVGLGTEYDLSITSMTIRVDLLSLNELYGNVLAHEQRLEQLQVVVDLSFYSANLASRSPSTCGRRSCN